MAATDDVNGMHAILGPCGRCMRLRVAAKVHDMAEVEYFEETIRPAIEEGIVEFLGEVGPDRRDALYGSSRATLMLGGWPEPFGLVAIESLAAGTPVIARRAGALPELIEHGVDGFLVDDLTEAEYAVSLLPGLDRRKIRARALRRFSAARMVDEYETVYRRLVAGGLAEVDGDARIAMAAGQALSVVR